MKKFLIIPIYICVFILFFVPSQELYSGISVAKEFNGYYALVNSAQQVNFGPRIYDSYAHEQEINWIVSRLQLNGWNIKMQEGNYQGRNVSNIIARNSDDPPEIIIGAHFDSRLESDRDPDLLKQKLPVPGANDGASGVAVLIELSRITDTSYPSIWLVFFDAEDDGDIQDQDWIIGSRFFVSNLEQTPKAVIILDMIGDKYLDIYRENNSSIEIADDIWKIAARLGFSDTFIDTEKYSMLDDHIPFAEKGIPTLLLIDFDYDYWHTNADTIDKLSSESLEKVGLTILAWINQFDSFLYGN